MQCLAVRVALVVCASIATTAHADVDRAGLFARGASVLKVEARRPQGGFSIGSGVVVAPEVVVTNCHVTGDGSGVSVLRGGLRWAATPRRSDAAHDLCVLHVPGLEAAAVPLGQAERLVPGESVTALGYTGGLGIQASDGAVLGLHRLDGAHVIRSSNWFSSGASGGGLFDASLQLVGILTFRLRGGEAHYFSAPVEWLRPLLEPVAETPAAVALAGADDVAVAAPMPAAPPYWQRSLAEQPRFLRAALLQHDARWPALAQFGAEWANEDPGDAEPWSLLGQALLAMGSEAPARRALECSLALEPHAADVRARLEAIPRSPGETTAIDSAASAGGLKAADSDHSVSTPALAATSCPVRTPAGVSSPLAAVAGPDVFIPY
jgi:serine protease Do